MKFVALFLCLAAASQARISETEMYEEWQKFEAKYKKAYTSVVEREFRYKIFVDNYQRIKQHNKDYEEGRVTYAMGINQFGDMLYSEVLEEMTGFVHPDGEVPIGKVADGTSDIPSSIDWRQRGAVTGVRQQGGCGSCWAFSAVGAIEGAHYIATGNLIRLSEQNLIDCGRPDGNNGCSGGNMYYAFSTVLRLGGIDTEASYPYTAWDSCTCNYNPANKGASISAYGGIVPDDELSLAGAVAEYGPVSVGVHFTQKFKDYKSGIFEDSGCTSSGINHAVLIVGYTSEYWIVKNSHGTDWGEGGYMRLTRGKNMCGVAHMAGYPLIY